MLRYVVSLRVWPLIYLFLVCANSTNFTAQAAVFDIIARTGQNGITAIENSASINDLGRVAFVATDSDGPGIWFYNSTGLDKIARDGSFTYGRELQLNNSNDIAAVRIRGGARSVRIWGTSVPILSDLLSDEIAQSTTTLPRSPDLFQGLGDYTTISNDGKVAFAGLKDSNVWEVHLSNTRVAAHVNHQPVVSFPSTIIFRPVAADGGRVVVGARQGATGPKWIYLNDPALAEGGFQTIASTTGGLWTNLGLRPGISDDGAAIAYYAAGSQSVRPQIRLNVAGTDVPIESTGSTSDKYLFGQFQSFIADSRIGVNDTKGSQLGQLKVVYLATDTGGKTGIFVSRINTNTLPTPQVISTYALAKVGDTIDDFPGLTITSLDLHDSINNTGAIVAWASTVLTSPGQPSISGQAILKNDGQQLYKQRNDSRNSWHDVPVHPNNLGDKKTFGYIGCTLAAAATIATFHGFDTDPVDLRNQALSRGLVSFDGDFQVGEFNFVRGRAVLKPQRASNQEAPYSFADIVSELRNNRPVLLKVPSVERTGIAIKDGMGLTNPDGSYQTVDLGHYVVALSIKDDTGGDVMPFQIRIHDPASLADNEDLRLPQYFDRTSEASVTGTFDVKSWFDEGTFLTKSQLGLGIPNGKTAAIPDRGRPQLITKFATHSVLSPGASLSVNSPVELIITEAGSSQRFVTSTEFQQAGDILLDVSYFDKVAPISEDVEVPDPSFFEDLFPPYTVSLPAALLGKSLDLEIVGLADGDYSISYNSLDGLHTASGPITGMTSTGMVSSGHFDVVPITVSISGDYNGNGVVDAADYVVWRNTLGQMGTSLAADGNSNGTIDSGDYQVWRTHFGKTAAGVGTSQSVPEPTVTALLCHALACGVWIAGRRRQQAIRIQ